jgi:aminotransferase
VRREATAAQPVPRGTALLYALISELKRYPDGISLGRGDPDFATPAHIIDAVRHVLARPEPMDGGPPEGLGELRRAIAERLRAVNRIAVDPEDEIVVTQGGQEALFLIVQTVVGPGDEIIVPEPNYNTYADAIAFAGGRRVSVMTAVEDNFDVDPDRVRAAISPATRALLLVSPNNPSAAVLSPERVGQLVQLAEEHDLIILADDIYDRFLYDGAVHTSPASLPSARHRTLTINSLSKAYAMTGWRLGWIAGPAPLIAVARRLKEAVSGPTSVIAQRAGLAALTGPQHPLDAMREAYARRRRIVLDTLDRLGLRYGQPQGGQFVFVDIRPTGRSSLELARHILDEAHVLAYPGMAFGEAWDGFLRITFLQPEPVLADGMRRLETVLRGMV